MQVPNSCTICLAQTNSISVSLLECGHVFHTICINSWQDAAKKNRSEASCPNCRQPIRGLRPSDPIDRLMPCNLMDRMRASDTMDRLSHPLGPSASAMQMEALPAAADQANHFRNQDNPPQPLCQHQLRSCVLCLVWFTVLFFFTLMVFFAIAMCFIFAQPSLPVFSIGINAKGYIALGVSAQGVLAVGIIGRGFITLSLLGYGVLFFVGQVGGGLGFGIYQIGIAWYCHLGQLSIGIWANRRAQLGVNLLSPRFTRIKHFQICWEGRD